MGEALFLIVNIVVLCLLNAGIIFIDDRLKRIMNTSAVHYLRLVLYVTGAFLFVLTQAGYSRLADYFVIEFIVIMLINLVEYYEQITTRILVELSVVIFAVLLAVCGKDTAFEYILLAGLVFGVIVLSAYIVIILLKTRRLEDVELKFILISIYIIIYELVVELILRRNADVIILNGNAAGIAGADTVNDLSFAVLITVLIIEIIGHAFCEYYNKADKNFKALEYANEQYEVDRIQKMYEESRRIKHDLKQCISSVKGHIEEGDYDNAVSLLDEISDNRIDSTSYKKYCDNKVVDYILNDKYARCKNDGIDFKCMVLGVIKGIDDIDLCILLGNIIDNAIEAAQKSQDKYVNIEITVRGTIFINVENSIKESFLGKKNAFESTKPDKMNHGIGTKSIYGIVEKYSGEVEYEEHGSSITCKVVLPEKSITG